MSDLLARIFDRYRGELSLDSSGRVRQIAPVCSTIGTDRIIESLDEQVRATLPDLTDPVSRHYRFSRWVAEQPREVRIACDLDLRVPPAGVHFIRNYKPGEISIFYDFRNTDFVLEEFRSAGVPVEGRLLDFGCSSGRNVATLNRACGRSLELFGVDPAVSSIDWARQQMPNCHFMVNSQHPPLDFAEGKFDLVMAKSIWTHFSSSIAKRWFREIARVLKPGGHFLFSTHGPHDVAYRLVYGQPVEDYSRFGGHPAWTQYLFLSDVVRGLDDEGFYFQPYKEVGYQGDLRNVENASTDDWGLTFMLAEYLTAELLPADLSVISRNVGKTGNRHDVYIVQKR